MKLSELMIGTEAKVITFGELSNDIRKKLMVMGLLPNTTIKLLRRAPMGDPLQIEVRGVSLAVRENIAALIDVEVK
ncbi:iron transporter FeoA [Vibrio sp. 10N.286.49.B3]|uniref:FeoA family protein n=1 Tax=Vibrio sp. 10N.286.49.B3 TaxID=1880855 RepID=UPI000C83CEBF|nr:FeoA family protein [Vibrio sp. 10N.286.49.B3]PMH41925.1 iron transporter FeoA [Vibrio sp. 10N.286.49.B3]